MDKIKTLSKDLFQWIVYSSNNPAQFSLTLKAGLPFLVLLGLGQYTSNATDLIDAGANMLVLIGQFISLCALVHGIVRKIWLTATA